MPVLRRCLCFALALTFALAGLPAVARVAAQDAVKAQTAAPAPSDLEARLAAAEKAIEEKRRELGVPGAALVVVKDDRVVYMKGLGVKDFEKKQPVTPDTLFAIGSSSKAFTAMLVAMAADAGKLALDDPPRKFLPYFKLQDAEADARITVRDLLSHSSGLNRTDIAWITGALTREEVIRVAAQAKPTAKLREKFLYQNVMYTAAGEVAARAEGSTWEQSIRERIFKPLGMKASVLTAPEMQRAPDYSFGYEYDEATKETRRLPQRDFPQVAAAGAINSNARDMAGWLRLMLGGGAFEGKRLVSEKSFAELVKPQQKIAGSVSYGLGWFLRDWHGHKVVEHGGNIDGFNAQVALMPDQRLGFVLLTNVTASALPATAMEAVWSNLVGKPEAKPETSAASSDPAARIETEVGSYLLAEAGVNVEVALKDGALWMTVPGQPTYKLSHAGGRRYKIGELPGYFATFRAAKDKAEETELYLEQPQGNFTLKKTKTADATTAPASGASAEYAGPLKEVVGSYDSESQQGRTIEVSVKDGKVFLVVPGQPPYPLSERSKDVLFSPALPDAYSLGVRRDEKGAVTGLLLKQPEGEFAFKRAPEFKPGLTADELMAKAVEAAGGEAAWRRHKTMTATLEARLEHQGVTAEGRVYAKAPNMAAQELTLFALGKKIGSFREFFDGAAGGEEASFMPFRPKTGKALADARVASDFYGLVNWKKLYKTVEIRKLAKVGDEDAYVVVMKSEDGNPVTAYFSTRTFLLLRRDTLASSGPVTQPVVEKFSDYRGVDGVMIPFTQTSSTPSNGDTHIRLKEVRFDADVPDKVFMKK
jgi:CubicO group peptidase (beta-lactamase class C family)